MPTFFNRQVLVKAVPGAKVVPSGTVTSLMNCALSQEEVGGGGIGVTGAGTGPPVPRYNRVAPQGAVARRISISRYEQDEIDILPGQRIQI